MSPPETVFHRVLEWAEREEPVRAVVLVGSRAASGTIDELSDYDLAIFARTHESYLQDDHWLSSIGRAWVCIPDHYEMGSTVIPTRLVLFDPGVKVDFAFHPLSLLSDVTSGGAHKVLLDKDGLARERSHRDREASAVPDEPAFVRLVHEFWFEAYHVAKYLHRGELWLVKSRDAATKALLLQMMEWHAWASHGPGYDTGWEGRGLERWVARPVWTDLHETFSGFDAEGSRRALYATIRLFRRLAQEAAERLGYAYPREVDDDIRGFIERVVAPDDTTGA
jgi:aminoglycoside 6-adenylyltransferase